MDSYSRYLQKLFLPIIIFTVFITIFFIYQIQFIRIENQSEKFGLPENDVSKVAFNKYNQLFGVDDYLIVALEFDSILTSNYFEIINQLTIKLNGISGVDTAISLANTYYPTLNDAGKLPLISMTIYEYYSKTNSNITWLLNLIQSSDLIYNNLISSDLMSATIWVKPQYSLLTNWSSNENIAYINTQIKTIINPYRTQTLKLHIAGSKLIDITMQEILSDDLKLFLSLSLIIFVLLLFTFLHNWKAVFFSITTAFISMIWSIGTISYTQTPVSLGLSMIIHIVLMSSVEYSIHNLHYIFRVSKVSNDHESKFKEMLNLYLKPNLLSGITTMVGFLALGFSELQGIREIGFFIAIGILYSTILNNVFLLAILKRWSKNVVLTKKNVYDPASNITKTFRNMVINSPGKVLLVSFIVFILLGLGSFRLSSDTNPLFYIDKNNEIRESFRFIDNNFGGSLPVEIIFHSTGDNKFINISELRSLTGQLKLLADLEVVNSVVNYYDYISNELNMDLKRYVNTDNMHFWATELGFLNNWILTHNDTTYQRISCRVRAQGSNKLNFTIQKISNILNTEWKKYSFFVTGSVPYLLKINNYVVRSFVYSFLIAFTFVLVVLVTISKSVKLGLFVLAGNLFPVIVVLGVMGWLGITLDISTVMIASITIGIAVNDTIFFIYRYRLNQKHNENVQDSIDKSFSAIGNPIIITTVILCAGFIIMIPSSFIPTKLFGLLSALIILLALVGDLLILPSLMNKFNKFLQNE